LKLAEKHNIVSRVVRASYPPRDYFTIRYRTMHVDRQTCIYKAGARSIVAGWRSESEAGLLLLLLLLACRSMTTLAARGRRVAIDCPTSLEAPPPASNKCRRRGGQEKMPRGRCRVVRRPLDMTGRFGHADKWRYPFRGGTAPRNARAQAPTMAGLCQMLKPSRARRARRPVD
jgi:hypothetical protein